MNFGSIIIKAVVVIVLLFLLSLGNALTFPAITSFTAGAGAGLIGILYLLVAMIVLSVIGNLLGRGIKSIKKPLEALILTFVGAFFLGAALALLTVLNIPYTTRVNLTWLGGAWYSSLLTLLFIGAPIMLIFLVAD